MSSDKFDCTNPALRDTLGAGQRLVAEVSANHTAQRSEASTGIVKLVFALTSPGKNELSLQILNIHVRSWNIVFRGWKLRHSKAEIHYSRYALLSMRIKHPYP